MARIVVGRRKITIHAALGIADAGCARGTAHRRIARRGIDAGCRNGTPAGEGRFRRTRNLYWQIVRGAARALAVVVGGVEQIVRTICWNYTHIIKNAAGICFLSEGAIWNKVRFDDRVVREVRLCLPAIKTSRGTQRGCGAKPRTGVSVGTEDFRRAGSVFGDDDRGVGRSFTAARTPGNPGTGLRRESDINRSAGVVDDADIAGRRRLQFRPASFLGDCPLPRVGDREN